MLSGYYRSECAALCTRRYLHARRIRALNSNRVASYAATFQSSATILKLFSIRIVKKITKIVALILLGLVTLEKNSIYLGWKMVQNDPCDFHETLFDYDFDLIYLWPKISYHGNRLCYFWYKMTIIIFYYYTIQYCSST